MNNSTIKEPMVEVVTELMCGRVLASTFRKPTNEELEEARASFIKGKCKHILFYDEEGWPYHIRKCYWCNEGLGLI